MNGQYTIFDSGERKEPHDYPFRRYIGQTVAFVNPNHALYGLIGEIVEILPYYTIVNVNGRRYAGTPYDIKPEDWTEGGEINERAK